MRGLSCPRCLQSSFPLNFLKLALPELPYNLFQVSCGDIGFKKIADQVLAWKSCRPQVPLLPLGPSCPPQAILLGDRVGFGSLQQIVTALAHFIFEFEADYRTILVSSGLL
jgi:hypothetical protein